jgi:hypothetical protein
MMTGGLLKVVSSWAVLTESEPTWILYKSFLPVSNIFPVSLLQTIPKHTTCVHQKSYVIFIAVDRVRRKNTATIARIRAVSMLVEC